MPDRERLSILHCDDQRQGMLPGNHFFALDPSMRPSATAKKSFSMASCPIFAWSSFTSGSSGFLLLVEDLRCPVQKLLLPLRDLVGVDLEAGT